jgi:hypothetical protein
MASLIAMIAIVAETTQYYPARKVAIHAYFEVKKLFLHAVKFWLNIARCIKTQDWFDCLSWLDRIQCVLPVCTCKVRGQQQLIDRAMQQCMLLLCFCYGNSRSTKRTMWCSGRRANGNRLVYSCIIGAQQFAAATKYNLWHKFDVFGGVAKMQTNVKLLLLGYSIICFPWASHTFGLCTDCRACVSKLLEVDPYKEEEETS